MTFESVVHFLEGFEAAANGELFDFRKPRDWQKGHMLWTKAYIAQPFVTAPKKQERSQ
jgi:hypothetical protein